MLSVRNFGIALLCIGINFSACIGTVLAAPPVVASPAESIVIQHPISPEFFGGTYACEGVLEQINVEDKELGSSGCQDSTSCIQQTSHTKEDRLYVGIQDSFDAEFVDIRESHRSADYSYQFAAKSPRDGPIHQQAIIRTYLTVKIE